ncbi:MAG: DUF1993 domain-containing protein [Polyangiaceae bacterium]|jgi:uncharacterized protein|nr:DUF1993 domain-containing protein [Polyangiaceae bacterium]
MSLYEQTVPQFVKMLRNLEAWLAKGSELAENKSFDVAVLMQARLAPDQHPLLRQVQIACDSAKFGAVRLTGKEGPKHPDTEQTLDELKPRIASCIGFLESLRPADFEGAETRKVSLPFLEGKFMHGKDYLVEFVLPNFYFHMTTAYAILRHNGVDVGKMDFLGKLPLHEA